MLVHFGLRAKMGLVIAVALHMSCNLNFYEGREGKVWVAVSKCGSRSELLLLLYYLLYVLVLNFLYY
jgi:hypothetical protein